jgi:acyl-CoA synthetase (NDP forming)
MADTCRNAGLDMPAPSAGLSEGLARQLPAYASLQNPVDMTANVIFDPGLMSRVMQQVADSDEYDAVLLCVNLIWRQGKKLAEELKRLAATNRSLLAVAWIAGKREHLDDLAAGGMPVFADPVRCGRAVAVRLQWQKARACTAPRTLHRVRRRGDAGDSPDLATFAGQVRLLSAYSIPLAGGAIAKDAETACQVATALGYPVCAKLVAPSLAHKSEIGAVHLGIRSAAELRERFAMLDAISMPDKEGILIQQMVDGALEIFVGMKRDAVFGPVIVVGIGGIYVEIIRETIMRPAPVDREAAESLLRGARFFPLLDGARGRPKLDVRALAQIVSSVSDLALEEPKLASLDLNPILVRERDACVVDFKIETSLG